AFGPKAAAIVGWCFYFAVPAGAPAAAMFGGAYVAAVTGGGHTTVIVTAAALIATVSAANAFGVTVSGRMQLVLSALLVMLLLAAVLASAPHARTSNLHPFAPHGWLAVGQAAALLVWSFAGWEAITHLAAEFRRPAHDMPRSAGIAVVVVGFLYLSVAAASVTVLGPSAGGSGAPLAELIAGGIGGHAQVLAAAAALLLTLGTMNAYFAGAAKLGAALGRDGALPAWLAQGSQVGGVPRRSLGVIAVLAAIALAATTISDVGPKPLVLVTSGCFVMVYGLGAAAALKLLPRGGIAYRCAWISLVAVAGLFLTTGWYLLCPLLLAGGALLYLQVAGPRQ
ncbi:APC family permease, partial [Burkholderia stabilis]